MSRVGVGLVTENGDVVTDDVGETDPPLATDQYTVLVGDDTDTSLELADADPPPLVAVTTHFNVVP